MGRIIEYTLISADGSCDNPAGFMPYRDDAYLRDGLGVLTACDAMLMGRNFYQASVGLWQARTEHPWAGRLNAMPKFVFSSTLSDLAWQNSTLISGDIESEVAKLKAETDGGLLIWGHTQLAETLLRLRLTDLIDLSIHPLLVGSGRRLSRSGQDVKLRLVATKSFASIVKLSFATEYS